MLRRGERSDVPIATNAPQQIVSLFDQFIGDGEHPGRLTRDNTHLQDGLS
jgi:hypothetical protein